MRKVKIHLLDIGYAKKPEGREYARINNSITKKVSEIDIGTFAEEVGINGRPFTPAIFNGQRKKDDFAQEQVYALDFDDGTTVDEFLARAERYQIMPAFIYATYNHSEDTPRFRAVFINDLPVRDGHTASIIISLLHQIFPEADKNCRDVSRLYLGGKGLLYEDLDAEINIKDLSISMQERSSVENHKNHARDIKSFGKKHGIKVRDSVLMIHRAMDDGQTEIPSDSGYILLKDGDAPSPYYVIETETPAATQQGHTRDKKDIRLIQNKSYQDIADLCPLFRDFYEKDLSHQQKFFLATNLIHVKGGQKLFFDGLADHQERWKAQWRYIRAAGYAPERCCNADCPYEDTCRCRSLYHKLASRIKRVGDDGYYVMLDDATCMLDMTLKSALLQKSNGIHLIKAQTSIGKTTAYCKIARCWSGKKPLMIAVPTMDLQRQVEKDMREYGVDTYTTPNVLETLRALGLEDLEADVMKLYETGFGHRVKKTIKRYLKEEQADLDMATKQGLEQYLKAHKKLNGQKCVVTTHAMLLALPAETLKQYEIIVDEDILMAVFKNTGSIPFYELQSLLESGALPAFMASSIQDILEREDGYVGHTDLGRMSRESLDMLYDKGLPIHSPVPEFLTSSTFYVDVQEEQVHYFKAKKIPDVKLVIVSASLNEKLYRDYCRGRYIHYTDIPLVRYQGRLIQYTAYSMSRSCIDDLGYETVKERIQKITQEPDINWITFKRFEKGKSIYFGKTEGFNRYKGQDLVVLGTPYNVPFMYQLIGQYLGYAQMGRMSVTKVEHNGYSFPIMTFKDPDMQNLQFHFMESELEQAIGRARLLRYPCTVYLFSNFPCRQAEIIQDDYMIE